MRGRGGALVCSGRVPAAVALVVSLGLHVVWVLAPERRAAPEPQLPTAAIELGIVRLQPAPPEPPAELASAEPPAPRVPARPVVARRPGASSALGSSAAVAAAPHVPSEPARPSPRSPSAREQPKVLPVPGASALSTSPAPAPGTAVPPAPSEGGGPLEAVRGPLDASPPSRAAIQALALSPRRAASSLVSAPGGETASAAEPRPILCAPSEPAAADSCSPDEAGSLAPARLQRSLEASARAVRHLAPRPGPRLRRQNDGSYRYKGISFDAHVERSGHVSFEEVKGSVSLGPLRVVGVFDLTDTIEHELLGKERYSSEKRWFLEQTAALRAELAESARAAEAMAARRALELELERIVSDSAHGPEHKRAQVFALWQACGDDAQARQTQRAVEAFVQRRMPQGSRLGYSQDELRRLNETRAGLRPFSPYLDPALDTRG